MLDIVLSKNTPKFSEQSSNDFIALRGGDGGVRLGGGGIRDIFINTSFLNDHTDADITQNAHANENILIILITFIVVISL
jgi:hypothetical protein